ncbi:GbsR/MarR family transcriptional regulator [Micromonospora sp. LOL_023]|uniref:GbsR/MarR family transcriptional regulator n=1 Tax=Micromonospora sp. LOL_023 TaxID=3345418 RepID=UPI003A879FDB
MPVEPTPEPAEPVDHLAAVRDFEQQFVAMMVQSGFPQMTARVLVSLFLSDSGSLTGADLVARLRVSPASVSKSIVFLERIGFVTRQRPPGQRRDRYAVDEGLWYRLVVRDSNGSPPTGRSSCPPAPYGRSRMLTSVPR